MMAGVATRRTWTGDGLGAGHCGRKTLKVIPISGNTQRIAISKDDRWVFTADQTKPQMAVIDTKTDSVAKWIPIEAEGYGGAVTPDGHWFLVALPM